MTRIGLPCRGNRPGHSLQLLISDQSGDEYLDDQSPEQGGWKGSRRVNELSTQSVMAYITKPKEWLSSNHESQSHCQRDCHEKIAEKLPISHPALLRMRGLLHYSLLLVKPETKVDIPYLYSEVYLKSNWVIKGPTPALIQPNVLQIAVQDCSLMTWSFQKMILCCYQLLNIRNNPPK